MAEKPEPVKVLYCGVCRLPAEYCEFGPEFDKCKPWLIQNAPDLYPDLPKDDADKVSDQLQSTSISSSSGASSTPKPEEVKRLPGGKVKKKATLSKIGRPAFDIAADLQALSLLTYTVHHYNLPIAPPFPSPSACSSFCLTRSCMLARQSMEAGLIWEKKGMGERKEVIIEKVVRNKRKCITTVKGLELFAVKLSDASKKLGKKFATGASVVKGPTEKEQIDVQGDISFDVVEFITDTWPDCEWYCLLTVIQNLATSPLDVKRMGSEQLLSNFCSDEYYEVPEAAIFFIEDGKKVPAA
ncbi:hypothetical protein V2J09_012339 [Rumex salicifolius]